MENHSSKYLYQLSAKKEYEELCAMEMRALFGMQTQKLYHFSNQKFQANRSPFFKARIDLLYKGKSLDTIEQAMKEKKMQAEAYKIHFIKYDDVPYQERLSSLRRLGFAIIGDYAMQEPKTEFALSKIKGVWYFGRYHKNPRNHIHRKHKPNHFSNALDTTLAKALINISINNDFSKTIIDPCAGVGTVIIEGRMLGVQIKGYEIKPLVKIACNENLEHFHFQGDVKKMDMLTSKEHFDVAILDLPYGQFSFISRDQQLNILKKTRELADKAIIVTMEDMTTDLNTLGYRIIDQCVIKKSNAFKRYVSICLSNK